jgi:hypothetical protein
LLVLDDPLRQSGTYPAARSSFTLADSIVTFADGQQVEIGSDVDRRRVLGAVSA